MNRIYVGNLPYSVDRAQLAEIFAPAGTVTDTAIPLNDQRRPKGFAFVSFENEEQMKKAIEMFDGKDVGGRVLRVNEARPREDGDRSGAPAPAREEVKEEAPADDMPADDTAADDTSSDDAAADTSDAATDDDSADAADDSDDDMDDDAGDDEAKEDEAGDDDDEEDKKDDEEDSDKA